MDTLTTASNIAVGSVPAGATMYATGVLTPPPGTPILSQIVTYMLPVVASLVSHLIMNLFKKKRNGKSAETN